MTDDHDDDPEHDITRGDPGTLRATWGQAIEPVRALLIAPTLEESVGTFHKFFTQGEAK